MIYKENKHKTQVPYHIGGDTEITILPKEYSGFDETTPLLQPQKNRAWDLVEALYPDTDSLEAEAFLDPKSSRLMARKRGVGKQSIPSLHKNHGNWEGKVKPKPVNGT